MPSPYQCRQDCRFGGQTFCVPNTADAIISKQENCIKDPFSIGIVGVCAGWELLSPLAWSRCRSVGAPSRAHSGMSSRECMEADADEMRRDPGFGDDLLRFRRRVGLVPF